MGVVKEPPYSLKRIMISRTKFDEWINKSKPGDKITYYRGYIMGPHLQKYSPTTDERRVRAIKNYAYGIYLKNLVTLVQKKHGDFDYEYMAVRV